MKEASILGRMRLKLRMEREVQAELDKIYPRDAFYIVPQRKTRA
jgi:hypothetical protein